MFLLGALFSTIGWVIGLIFSFLIYLFSALGFYTMAKRANIDHAWIAWIPICQWYLLGELIGDKVFGIGNIKWFLVLLPLITGVVGFFTTNFIYDILVVASFVLEVAAYYKLFQIYNPKWALVYTITGIFITPLLGIYVFANRNKPRQRMIAS